MNRRTLLLSALFLSSVSLLGTQHAVRAQVQEDDMMMAEDAMMDDETVMEDEMMADGEPLMQDEIMDDAAIDEPPTEQEEITPSSAAVQKPAQRNAQPAEPKAGTVNLRAGDILEILPVHAMQDPSFAWILTQDRTFIQADRNPLFRIRLTEQGSYTLTTEITSGDKSVKVRKIFTINIAQRAPGNAVTPSGGSQLVTSVPKLSAGGDIILPKLGDTVLLTPTGNLRPLNIDLDLSADSDGNGNPFDDVDNVATLFQTDATPMLLWFVDPVTKRDMQVSALKGDGTLLTQALTVRSTEQARSEGVVQSPIAIQDVALGDGSHQFSVIFKDDSNPDDPMLFRWQFGDGTESLETQPTHVFTGTGAMTVSVSVKNLLTGKDVGTATKSVKVGAAPASSVSSEASAESSSSSEQADTPEDPSSDSDMIATIVSFLPLIGAFLGALIIGMIAVTVVSMVRKKKGGEEKSSSLQKHFEQMETKLLQKEQVRTATPVAPTATPTTPPPSVAQREVDRSTPPQRTEPPIDVKQAPSWLKQGLQGQTTQAAAPAPQPSPAKPAAPAASPTPPPVSAPKKPEPTPTPPVQKKPEPAKQAPTAPKPPMPPATPNQPSAPAPKAPAPQPAPEPAKPQTSVPAPQPPAKPPVPAAPAQPKPQPVPTPQPTPQAAVQPSSAAQDQPIDTKNAPSWLKQGLQGKPDLAAEPKAAPATPTPKAPEPAPNPVRQPQAPVTPPAAEDPTVAVIKAEGLGQAGQGEQKAG